VTLASKVADAETYTHETKHRFLQSQTELQQQLVCTFILTVLSEYKS